MHNKHFAHNLTLTSSLGNSEIDAPESRIRVGFTSCTNAFVSSCFTPLPSLYFLLATVCHSWRHRDHSRILCGVFSSFCVCFAFGLVALFSTSIAGGVLLSVLCALRFACWLFLSWLPSSIWFALPAISCIVTCSSTLVALLWLTISPCHPLWTYPPKL